MKTELETMFAMANEQAAIEEINRELLAALYCVQEALACDRDNVPYVHPIHGAMAMEEVKYLIVDAAIAKAEGRA